MIHEMHENLVIPEDGVLTFDDGLYTQYLFGRDLPHKKIFFISSGIICDGHQSTEFITCRDAHKKAFAGNFENYMTLDQIMDLDGEIGGHSHSHTNLNSFSTLVEKVDYIKRDTETMLEWFQKNLGYEPTSFCFPYNDDMDGLYRGLLRKYGFTDFYGNERISVESLQPNRNIC
jgi:hypothetical protein